MIDEESHVGNLTATQSWGNATRGIIAYLNERFPIPANGLLILSFSTSNQFVAQALVSPGERLVYDVRSLLSFVVLLCFFLHLRIFDDHKDYKTDCENFPDRVLQRGDVTLRELKILAVLAIGIELALAAAVGRPALVAMVVAIAFSLLMLKEFFLRAWLRRRFVLYATVHMSVMPLLSLTVFSFATGRFAWQAPFGFWPFAVVGYFLAFNWEVSRKIRVPEQEVASIDTYTQRFGTYGAAWLVLLIRVIDTSLMVAVGWMLGVSFGFYLFLVVLFLICMIGFIQFRFQTSIATARRMELFAGIYILAFDLGVVAELVRLRGIELGGGL